jgi:putative amidoligase enzyme
MLNSKRVFEMWMKRLGTMNHRLEKAPVVADIPERVIMPLMNRGVGVEIEVENVDNDTRCAGWTVVPDGSLRENGLEFITTYGARVYEVKKLVDALAAKFAKQKVTFGARTSVHVHLDVRYFPVEQLEALLIVYTIFEDALFNFAGPDRKSNVFCVPFRYTHMLENMNGGGGLVRQLARMRENQKYCAINLAAVGDKGTVEFRHMTGNCDSDHIFKWVFILGLLLQYARRAKLPELHEKVKSIKCSSQYDDFKKEVFYSVANEIQCSPASLDESLSDAKLLFNVAQETI